jgi:GMP synthase (glutamine-hydrolysing)
MALRTAAALRHVHFEDLGSFAPALRAAGYDLDYHDVSDPGFKVDAVADADLLVVLGGPVGVYDDRLYPFIRDELALVEARLAADRPILGICLGAQIIACAAGAPVYPTGFKEIGWGGLALTDAGLSGPLHHLDGLDVLHWHGDTFDLPGGCTLLASTGLCPNQAFSRGGNVLAVQFHPEVLDTTFEPWLVGHACELAGAGMDPIALRDGARKASPALAAAAPKLIADWLAGLRQD